LVKEYIKNSYRYFAAVAMDRYGYGNNMPDDLRDIWMSRANRMDSPRRPVSRDSLGNTEIIQGRKTTGSIRNRELPSLADTARLERRQRLGTPFRNGGDISNLNSNCPPGHTLAADGSCIPV
jgi:hypothetical protein